MRLLRRILVPMLLLVGLLAPPTASADVANSYRGWGTVEVATNTTQSAYANAWQWYTGYGWWPTWRERGTNVWIQSYAPGWSWTWTSTSGWLAMRVTDLSSPAPATLPTGAKGLVSVGPLCPVEPCGIISRPIVRLTFTEDVGARLVMPRVRTTYSDSDGVYHIALPPGRWFVSSNYGINWRAEVTVPTSGYVTRNFEIDSGIRTPVLTAR